MVIEPVVEAMRVMESLTDCNWLVCRHAYRYSNEGIGKAINHLLNTFAARLGEARPHDRIPLLAGEVGRFSTRQFRRTVGWHLPTRTCPADHVTTPGPGRSCG
ncbi:hypothetical protein, partial [Streptomyces pratensis]